MNVTLVRLPFYSLLGNSKSAYPIGLGYLSSALKGKGVNVTLVDGETVTSSGINSQRGLFEKLYKRLMPSKYFNRSLSNLVDVMEDPLHEIWETLAQSVLSTKPDLIGITTFSQNITGLLNFSNVLNKNANLPIVVGGIHPSAAPEWTLRNIEGIDYVVVGEGENTIVDLCDVLMSGSPHMLSGIQGIAYRENGRVKINSFRPLIQDIDSLPFPDRSLGDRRDYSNTAAVFTSRGCPYMCNFCASNILWTRKVRFRSMENVVDEIEMLADQYGTTRIRIDDDTFTLSKKRIIKFCDLIKERGLHKKLTFSLGSRVDKLDEEMIRRLAEIGTDTISFGIESGSQRILQNIEKGITTKQVKETIKRVSAYGIRCLCYFMVGHPNETMNDVKQSMDLFDQISNRYVDAEVNIVSPYPGTKLWDIARDSGWDLKPNEYHILFHQGDFSLNLSDMEDHVLSAIYNEFLSRISRHSVFCKVNTIMRMIFTGRIRNAFRLVMNK